MHIYDSHNDMWQEQTNMVKVVFLNAHIQKNGDK